MTKEVLNHLRDLQENLRDWETYLREISEDDFLTSRKDRHALLHAVLVSLQAAIDAGNHWIAEQTSQRPESYRAIPALLAESGKLPAKLAQELQGLFALRNVLIHGYQDLDLKRLYRHLRCGPKPLRTFLSFAKKAVGK